MWIVVKMWQIQVLLLEFSGIFFSNIFHSPLVESMDVNLEVGRATPRSRSGGAAVRRYHSSKVRNSGCTLLEQP